MVERLSLRLRVFLFFALIGLGTAAAIAVGMYLAAQRIGPQATSDLVLFGGMAAFVCMGLSLWVWSLFDQNVVYPINSLVADIRATVHAGGMPRLTEKHAKYLGNLGPSVREAMNTLVSTRTAIEDEVVKATSMAEQQKRQLEAVLHDLDQGVVICTLDHKTLLYNRRALELLHVSGDFGLGRDLLSILSPQPVRHALERLSLRIEENRHQDHPEGVSALLVCATRDGNFTLQGRIGLILDSDDARPIGYVATFDDVTATLARRVRRDRMLQEAIEDIRRPIANIRAASEVLAEDPHLEPDMRREFESVLNREAISLSERLDMLEAEQRDLLAGSWPMSDVSSAPLFACVVQRDSEDRNLTVEVRGAPVWTHCDSLTIVELIDRMMNRVCERTGIRAFALEAHDAGNKVYLDLCWNGDVMPVGTIDAWLGEQLDASLGGLTGREVLDRHKSEFWCERRAEGGARLRLPLAPAIRYHRRVSTTPAPQLVTPQFYDFDLFRQIDPEAIDETPLRALTYVVFDTETTGLEPSRGDEIIQIAGVRIVNGRLLRGEIFDQLVHPGRTIPAESTKVHHITNEMVKDAPPIGTVLPRFHAFAKDAVLVAHNAAFDMRFLTLKQDGCGVRFDNPVLDTVLLGAHLYGAGESLSLDALTERFGIEIAERDRHTALGDSLATGELFLRFLDVLEAAGVRTLREAIEASNQIVAIKRKQAAY